MKKLVFLLAVLISISLSAQDVIEVSLDAPESVVAGSSFEVTITFNKGDLKDYSRFSQDLPEGFTASNIDSPNADFTFTDQRVRIIWLKLPAEQQVQVKYAIQVNERLKGELNLGGTFAYVNNGERAYIDLSESYIVNVEPNPNIDPSLVVNISDFPEARSAETGGQEALTDGSNTVIRQKPVVGANGIVNVTLLVKKPEGTNYLKLEEKIPGGYSFESIEKSNAIVSQASSLARYVWMQVPAADQFIVSYRLIPILEEEQEALNIEGNLSYTSEGETKVVSVKEMDANIAAMTAAQRAELLSTGKIPEGVPAESLAQNTAEVPVTTSETKDESVASKNTSTTSKPDVPVSKKVTAKPGTYEKSSATTMANIPALQAVNGVYFRVQVAAVRNPYFAQAFFSDYDLLREVKMEKESGWSKYTVGPVSSYDDAVALKKRIIRETPVNTAFVVAYRDGSRIPVSEAR